MTVSWSARRCLDNFWKLPFVVEQHQKPHCLHLAFERWWFWLSNVGGFSPTPLKNICAVVKLDHFFSGIGAKTKNIWTQHLALAGYFLISSSKSADQQRKPLTYISTKATVSETNSKLAPENRPVLPPNAKFYLPPKEVHFQGQTCC